MNGKQLKNSILQWAIQGKLVPQDPNDEPASVLLERIRKEKERLVKEKKIKKDKNASIIFRGEDNSYYEKFLATGEVKCIDEEIPFEIPENWMWVRLESICTYIQRGKSPKYSLIKKYPVVAQKCNQWSGFSIEKAQFIEPKTLANYSKDRILQDEDLMWNSTGLGTLGRMAIYYARLNPYELAVVDSHVTVIRLLKQFTIPMFFYFYFASPAVQSVIEDKADGSTKQKELSTATVCSYLIPLPPIDEQKRIVNLVDTISPLVEKYGKQQSQLDNLNIGAFEALKKSILQEAIQGKLVPQIQVEGTAEELLAEIRKEKELLLKEGKLKKSALTDSVIFKGDDNKYYEQTNGQVAQIECDYDFPNNWAVTRLSSICTLVDGEKKDGQQICLDAKYLRGKSAGDYLQRGRFVQKGDNIILVDGENSGEVFTVPCDGYMGSTFKQLWFSSVMHLPYVLNYILFYKELLRKSKRGAAIPHLNKEIFYSLIIGIPPYQEQVRIVNKINEICSKIKV